MIPGILESLPKERLPEREEQDLARELVNAKNSARYRGKLKETLVLHSMLEAFFYARRCCRAALPADEIYSLCYSALCRAAENFKPRKIRFFSYAKVFIRGEISREWKNKSLIKNVPSGNVESTGALTVSDQIYGPGVAKDSTTCGGESATLVPTVEPEFSSIHARELWELLSPLLESKLSPSERTVIFMRYRQELNFREIGSLLGITRQGAQSLHVDALVKLRLAMDRNKKVL